MNRLKSIISKFSKAKILIIGDLILDEYVWGDVERISPEAPVPVVWANKSTFLPGGAANVASNIRSLGANVNIVGIVGKDERAHILLSELKVLVSDRALSITLKWYATKTFGTNTGSNREVT